MRTCNCIKQKCFARHCYLILIIVSTATIHNTILDGWDFGLQLIINCGSSRKKSQLKMWDNKYYELLTVRDNTMIVIL